MPPKVVAWAIAIERYDAAGLNITQPVGDWAARFVQLANRRGVDRIVFSSSLKSGIDPIEFLAGVPAEKIKLTDATQTGLRNAFQYLQDFDVLLLYWVGHGIMAPARQLLCSDSADMSDLASIVTDSLLKRLCGSTFPQLQIGFFECCAQTVASGVSSLNLSGDDSGRPSQFFYYAASQGEVASASTAKEGFSTTILKQLDTAQFWPPEPRPLFSTIQTELDKLSGSMRPLQLEKTNGSGDVWSILYGKDLALQEQAKSARCTLPQFLWLWKYAQRCNVSAEQLADAILDRTEKPFLERVRENNPGSSGPKLLKSAFEQVRHERQFEPLCMALRLPWAEWTGFFRRVVNEEMLDSKQTCDDIASLLFGVLDQANIEKGLQAFAKLLELAARRTSLPGARKKLRAALKKDLPKAYKGALERMGPDSEWSYLQLDVDVSAETGKPTLIKAWLYPNVNNRSQQIDLAGGDCLADEINGIVQRVLSEYPERSLAIELLLPTTLISISKEMLLLEDAELGLSTCIEEKFPIIVRWKNRMQDRGNKYRGTWISSSSKTLERADGAQQFICSWVPGQGQPADFHVLALAFAGPSPADPNRNRKPFFEELTRGEPYMCWPREEFADTATSQAYRDSTNQFFGQGVMPSLLLQLPKERRDAPLGGAVLLVDLPERNPYDSNSNLLPMK